MEVSVVGCVLMSWIFGTEEGDDAYAGGNRTRVLERQWLQCRLNVLTLLPLSYYSDLFFMEAKDVSTYIWPPSRCRKYCPHG